MSSTDLHGGDPAPPPHLFSPPPFLPPSHLFFSQISSFTFVRLSFSNFTLKYKEEKVEEQFLSFHKEVILHFCRILSVFYCFWCFSLLEMRPNSFFKEASCPSPPPPTAHTCKDKAWFSISINLFLDRLYNYGNNRQ